MHVCPIQTSAEIIPSKFNEGGAPEGGRGDAPGHSHRTRRRHWLLTSQPRVLVARSSLREVAMRDHQSVVKNNNTSQVLSVMDDLLQGNDGTKSTSLHSKMIVQSCVTPEPE